MLSLEAGGPTTTPTPTKSPSPTPAPKSFAKAADQPMPHIPMRESESPVSGWLMTLLLGLLGGATALIALYFMSKK